MQKLCSGLLVLIGSLFTWLFFVTLTLHNDHVQILKKAFVYIDTGVLTHFGNAATGVGFVPGSFLTVVTAIPMSLYFSPYSAMAVIFLFHLISWFLMSRILKANLGPLIVLDFLLLYWISPWRVQQSELYNPAYVFLFTAVHFYTAYHLKNRSFWMSFFNILAIGFCAQVHYSAVILAVLSLMLFYVQLVKVNWWGVAAGVATVLASCIPYALQYFSNETLQVTMNKSDNSFFARNLVMVYPVLKGISYWVRYGAIAYGRHIFSEITFLWIAEGMLRTIVDGLFHSIKYVFAVITVVWSFRVQWKLGKDIWKASPFARRDRTDIDGVERIYYYAFYFFFAMLIAVALSPVELNHWHIILCFPIVSVVITIAFHEMRQKMSVKKFRLLYVSLLLIFCMFNLFGAWGGRSHSFDANFHDQVMQLYKEERK